MKKLVTTLCALALIVGSSSAFAANAVRISQVYGGGGSGTAAYTHDYIELYNSSTVAVDISGWSIEYGSATGLWASFAGNILTFPSGSSIGPCGYVLISGSSGTGGVPLPVAADHVGTLTLSGSTGKVGLFTQPNVSLACGSEIPGTLVDKVSYGTGNCPETTNVGTLSSLTAAIRKMGGAQDTDDNSADFTIEGSFVPRNSASAGNPDCLATPAVSSSWGAVKNIYR